MNIVYIIIAIIILIILACFFTAEYNTRGDDIAKIQADRAIIEETLRDSGASDDQIEDILERIDDQIDDLSRGVAFDNVREYIPRGSVNPDTIRILNPDVIRRLASREFDPDTIRTLDSIRNNMSRVKTLTSSRDIAERVNDARQLSALQPTQIPDVNNTRSATDRDVVESEPTR